MSEAGASGGEMSSKEEEDNAWWSDYQASTKLKRKFKKEEQSDQDNFDDLLSDLGSISRLCDASPVGSSSRKSSTSGYETLSSVCTTPECRGKQTW